jgi:hypothetical protein
MPLVVVTASGSLKDTPSWAAAQDKLTALSTNEQQVVAETTHPGMLDQPVGADASASAVETALGQCGAAALRAHV